MTDEVEDEGQEIKPARWSWVYLAGCGVNTLGNVCRVVTQAADEVSLRLARHDAWREGQRAFAESVRHDLESVRVIADR